MAGPADVTALLVRASEGDSRAASELLPLVYDKLRSLAGHLMRGERVDHTLQPTALVHEAYLKLIDQTRVRWEDRAHFFSVAAQALRRILVDYARQHGREKRGGSRKKLQIQEDLVGIYEKSVDLVALDEALGRLSTQDAQRGRVVELRFFGGLTIDETAAVLDISPRAVERQWRYARAWLYRELADETN